MKEGMSLGNLGTVAFHAAKVPTNMFSSSHSYFPVNSRPDQTARMRRLVCVFVVHKPPKTGFLTTRPIIMIIMVRRRSTWFTNTKQNTRTFFLRQGEMLYS